jgi:hypothetical protein
MIAAVAADTRWVVQVTEYVLAAGKRLFGRDDSFLSRVTWRILVLAAIVVLLGSSTELRHATMQAMSDAYLQVTVFVAGTLAIVYGLESYFKGDLGRALGRSGMWQAPLSSFLGALPGCGGAIIVVTQYTRGHVSFGSVVAVLVATMGDAAFLLLAREPMTGLFIFAMGFGVGTLSGWIVDRIHSDGFLRPGRAATAVAEAASTSTAAADRGSGEGVFAGLISPLWIALLVPGIGLGLLVALQLETDHLFGPLATMDPTVWFGFLCAGLCLIMWVFAPYQNSHAGAQTFGSGHRSVWRRIVQDTNFITTWVILGFLVFEIGTYYAGAGIEVFFTVWAPLLPLMGVLVGFLPGCGPQIVVTTLYLAGLVPMSAQIGNAISNDGDALFPAIALAPRAAVVATAYSAVPALIFAYGYYLAFE